MGFRAENNDIVKTREPKLKFVRELVTSAEISL